MDKTVKTTAKTSVVQLTGHRPPLLTYLARADCPRRSRHWLGQDDGWAASPASNYRLAQLQLEGHSWPSAVPCLLRNKHGTGDPPIAHTSICILTSNLVTLFEKSWMYMYIQYIYRLHISSSCFKEDIANFNFVVQLCVAQYK